MFRKNQGHLQQQMLTSFDSLPESQLTRLHNGWAGVFSREFFSRLDEQPFAVLFSAKLSRPNIPVNVLIALEALKAGFNWSDEELFDACCFDLQVRFALGLHRLDDGHFTLRSLYNFRRRLSFHLQQTGINLFEQAFAQITDEQLTAFHLKTGKLRMDSSQIAGNIRSLSRLHLLVEVVQRIHRMLAEADRTPFAELLAPYLQGHAHQYVYRVKGEDGPAHMQRLGEAMLHLLEHLPAHYREHPAYGLLQRVFTEHFVVGQEPLRLKTGSELRADSLQSPDDPEATYHQKRGRGYKGYVVNVTETCDPENPLQLIAHVQTHPNVVDDSDLLIEALPELRRRLGVEELHTDGGYNGEQADAVAQELGLTHVQTALRGQAPQRRLGLDAFVLDAGGADHDRPVRITCPNGQTVAVELSVRTSSPPRYRAVFDAAVCGSCPLQERCPARAPNKRRQRTLSFSRHEVGVARQRQRVAQNRQTGTKNLRVVIESTIGSLKQPFNYGQLPVRGRFRVGMLLVGGAAMANVRRIWRYLSPQRKPQDRQEAGTGAPPVPLAWRLPGLVALRRLPPFPGGLARLSVA